jgi:hypothetical protein
VTKRSARPARLTEAEARTLTRGEILDRLEAESEWWTAHRPRTDADHKAYATFARILNSSIDPAAAIQDTLDYVQGRGTGSYWATRPAGPASGAARHLDAEAAPEPEAEP